MAHAGKYYPLHLRRDWAPDLTNFSRAHAKDYYLFSPSSFGTIGDHLSHNELRAREYLPVVSEPPEWRSDWTLVNGRLVRIIVKLTSVHPLGFMGNSFEIFDSVQGSVARATGGVSTVGGYASLAGHYDQTWKPHPTLFDSSPGTIWNLNAVPWSDF